MATRALALFPMNLIFANLAGVTTFLVPGIHPATCWEKNRAVKVTPIASVLWATLLAALIALLLLSPKT